MEENPYVAPESEPGVDIPPAETLEDDLDDEIPYYEYAGFVRRAVAKGIDVALFLVLSTFVLTAFVVVKGLVVEIVFADPSVESVESYQDGNYVTTEWEEMEQGNDAGLSEWMLNLIYFVSFVFFAGLSEWMSGQSLGKLSFGLQVVRDGPPALPSLGMALGRNAGMLVDGMFFGVVAYMMMRSNPRRQRSGDLGAHTVVVVKSSIPGPPLSTTLKLLLGMLAGVGVVVATTLLVILIDPTL